MDLRRTMLVRRAGHSYGAAALPQILLASSLGAFLGSGAVATTSLLSREWSRKGSGAVRWVDQAVAPVVDWADLFESVYLEK